MVICQPNRIFFSILKYRAIAGGRAERSEYLVLYAMAMDEEEKACSADGNDCTLVAAAHGSGTAPSLLYRYRD